MKREDEREGEGEGGVKREDEREGEGEGGVKREDEREREGGGGVKREDERERKRNEPHVLSCSTHLRDHTPIRGSVKVKGLGLFLRQGESEPAASGSAVASEDTDQRHRRIQEYDTGILHITSHCSGWGEGE